MTSETIVAKPLALTLEWDKDKIAAIHLGWSTGVRASARLSGTARALLQALERYVRGEAGAWPELPLDLERVSPFTRQVLEVLAREVPAGATLTYGQLAARCGRPKAARAVGRAMAANRWPLVLPCHRVLGAGGALTGYSNPAGVDLKRFLLELEGAL
jgi:methylated-DNA-[protein]-cysteine S-methyltransferase